MLDEIHREEARPSRMAVSSVPENAAYGHAVAFREQRDRWTMESSGWQLSIEKAPFALVLENEHGAEQHRGEQQRTREWTMGRDGSGLSWAGADGKTVHAVSAQRLAKTATGWKLSLKTDAGDQPVALEVTPVSTSLIHLSIQADALGDRNLQIGIRAEGPFFGLGERFTEERVDGLKTTLRPEDLFGKPGHNWTYIPIPLLYNPHGLGLYLDTSDVSTFDLSRASEQRISVQLDHPSVDAYLFAGQDAAQTLSDYTSITGRTPLSPPWAFGPWICSYQGLDRVLADAKKLREEQMPVSAIWTFDVMDRGDIMGWPLWYTGYYPHPRALTDALHAMGFKALTYVHPYIRSVLAPYSLPSPAFEEGKRDGLFVLNKDGQPSGPRFEPYVDGNLDFTRPANVDWYEARLKQILLDENFDGWMEDYGEWVNRDDQFAAGVTGRTMENLNPLFYHRATYEIAHAAKADVVGFVRSGYSASQAYTRVVWGGDQFPDWTQDHGLPSVVRAGITTGLSGFGVWGPDIEANGYSRELWMRWTEFGALTPIMRDHPWDKPASAMNLWHDPEAMHFYRDYARLHTSLFPYLYTYAKQAEQTGIPMMRHPMLAWPDDPATYTADTEYLLGSELLVAPVTDAGATSRRLYLPQGEWVNYWTGEKIEGKRTIDVPAPLEQIPILVRAGSILPSIDPAVMTLASDLSRHDSSAGDFLKQFQALTSSMTWRIYPSTQASAGSFTLFDGTRVSVRQSAPRIEVQSEHDVITRTYEVLTAMAAQPRSVALNGHALAEGGAAGHDPRWWFDAENRMLHVAFTAGNFALAIAR